ncbi:4 TMS phage holin, superfamily IV [Cribrihabitans marinus]|uniref:4 TMS phage holin, superfamily IV n=1 Tax=Cribrihabitans marinus TaxID=1227549 RepID=A0A1H6XUU5_9RHOB|nr:phage holin family protein [Cribrihabitans marinus]GGH28079.1 hypothetical protein GCM10010973_16770 [Cribrihabitans marinus]SEJ32799.1 4 TMS phage holin, superfamily IV [Cribrihabitans marinus]
MSHRLLTIVALLIANAVGLLLAALLLDGFSIQALSLLIVVVIFTVVQVIADPLVTRLSERNLPALRGGVALAVVFVGLIVTNLLVAGFTVGGIANLLAATLLVWLGALIAGVLLPVYVFKTLRADKTK